MDELKRTTEGLTCPVFEIYRGHDNCTLVIAHGDDDKFDELLKQFSRGSWGNGFLIVLKYDDDGMSIKNVFSLRELPKEAIHGALSK